MREVDQLKHFEKSLAELFEDPQPIDLCITKRTAWIVMSTIQLASRHPLNTGQPRECAEAFARHLQASLVSTNNDLRLLAEMGWLQQYDHGDSTK